MKTKLTFIPSYALRLFAVVVFLQNISTAVMADEPVTLNVHLSDGTTQSILLYTRPQVTFEGDRVVFTSPVATFSYDAQLVVRFTYSGSKKPDRVTAPEAYEPYRQTEEQLIFDAKVKASDIQLFREDGMRMSIDVKNSDGRPSLSIKTLPSGVYLLKVNDRTSKILKK